VSWYTRIISLSDINDVRELFIGARMNYSLDPNAYDSMVQGRMDDFKIYGYALSPAEIVGEAKGVGQPGYKKLWNNCNSDSSDMAINLGDFAIMANKWMLGTELWP